MEGGVIIKLPNGYGTVYKLSGNRRKPYIVRKTIGWEITGKQLYQTIGYYATKQEGLQALAEYNNDPYNLSMSKHTFSEIYELWYKEAFDEKSNRSTVKNYKTAYNHCMPLYNMRITDIRLVHMQRIIDESEGGYYTAIRIKVLLNKVFDWCIEREYLRKNYAENLRVPKYEQKTERRAFSKEHIQRLWDCAKENTDIQLVLMLIYSGVRINELLKLKKEDVDLSEQWFKVRASKTSAGVRIVPIADKVLLFGRRLMNCQSARLPYVHPTGGG